MIGNKYSCNKYILLAKFADTSFKIKLFLPTKTSLADEGKKNPSKHIQKCIKSTLPNALLTHIKEEKLQDGYNVLLCKKLCTLPARTLIVLLQQ